MKYGDENGFKTKIENFIKDDITAKGSFGPSYLTAPDSNSDPDSVMIRMVEDSTLKNLFENIRDDSMTISEAASRLNIKDVIDKQITGRQLASLIISYFFLRDSNEILEKCKSIKSMKSDNYENLWTDTKHFPIKNKTKTTVFHTNVIKLISEHENINSKDIVSLSKHISTKSKNMSNFLDQMYESVIEVHGVCEQMNSYVEVNMGHDISKTIPQVSLVKEDVPETVTKHEENKASVPEKNIESVDNKTLEEDTVVKETPTPMDWSSIQIDKELSNGGARQPVFDDPLEAFAFKFKHK